MRALSWPMMNAMTLLPAAAKWFETSRVDDATTLIIEPHVDRADALQHLVRQGTRP